MAQLHLGLLALEVINKVRQQQKKVGIHCCWGEIIRAMNT